MTKIKRCSWVETVPQDPLEIQYHDQEWGRPLHDEQKLFEILTLETFQAGLSWRTILHKRANFRKAFDQFDYNRIANYSPTKMHQLLADPGIVRNQLKIKASIQNARAYLAIQDEFGSFDHYIWHFTDGQSLNHHLTDFHQALTQDTLSQNITKDLKKHHFSFVGPVGIYAFLQSIGIINDHEITCQFYHPTIAG